MTRKRVAVGCTMALAASTMIAGCQTHSADKASGDTAVLTLATIDEVTTTVSRMGRKEDAMTALPAGAEHIWLGGEPYEIYAVCRWGRVFAHCAGGLRGVWQS